MKKVGIRELRAHLSAYLTRVRDGEELIVTDRGKPVAWIQAIPAARPDLPERVRRLIESGRMIDKGPMRHLPTPIRMTPGEKTSTDYVREQRR